MCKCVIEARVTFSWWVPIYTRSVILFCQIFDTFPDVDKMSKIIMLGCKVKIVAAPKRTELSCLL